MGQNINEQIKFLEPTLTKKYDFYNCILTSACRNYLKKTFIIIWFYEIYFPVLIFTWHSLMKKLIVFFFRLALMNV